MSKEKNKFELYQRLQALGFTYEESQDLRRIEMTLQRWAERECGDGSNWAIERDETTGKPFNVYHANDVRSYPRIPKRYPIADRESGALKRLGAIVAARNKRMYGILPTHGREIVQQWLFAYHQPDPRGCALYLITREQSGENTFQLTHDDKGYSFQRRGYSQPYPRRFDTEEKAQAFAFNQHLESCYTRGLAVCC